MWRSARAALDLAGNSDGGLNAARRSDRCASGPPDALRAMAGLSETARRAQAPEARAAATAQECFCAWGRPPLEISHRADQAAWRSIIHSQMAMCQAKESMAFPITAGLSANKK